MTKAVQSAHTEKLGVAAVGRICALARTFFRPILTDDVGIDGFIELTDQGDATGILIGVQIKSGESFVKDQGSKFIFKSDQTTLGIGPDAAFR